MLSRQTMGGLWAAPGHQLCSFIISSAQGTSPAAQPLWQSPFKALLTTSAGRGHLKMTEGGPCISSVMRAPNLCHSHKLLGGAASILLLPGVTRATFTTESISTFKPVKRMPCYHSQRIGLRDDLLNALFDSI